MGPFFKSYLSDKINLTGQKRYVNLAGHHVQRLSGNYFEPCERNFFSEVVPGHCKVFHLLFSSFGETGISSLLCHTTVEQIPPI